MTSIVNRQASIVKRQAHIVSQGVTPRPGKIGKIAQGLLGKIKRRQASVGVVGLGYVGLPLAIEFAKAGFRVTGIDIDGAKVRAIQQGRSYVQDVPVSAIRREIAKNRLAATTDYRVASALDTISICVPTPLRKTREPDISYVLAASEEIAKDLRPGQLIILESTTYSGTTEEVLKPMFEAGGLVVGKDIFLGFSPERVDPGNPRFTTRTIPKVVSGITPTCARVVEALYRSICDRVILVSSTKVAETVKLLENTFRSINIALVNELAMMCQRLHVDVWEVIRAAATKPFGFMPFYPGPGIGGECIPADPMYLAWKARMNGFEPRLIELASQINASMPHFVVDRISEALNHQHKPLRGSKVLIVGVAYKRDVGDIRESPALEIMGRLLEAGVELAFYDPFVERVRLGEEGWERTELSAKTLGCQDCVVIATDHSRVDYELIWAKAPLIVDTRNVFDGRRHPKLVRL